MRISMGTTSYEHCCSSLNFVRTMFIRHFADTAKGANTANLPNLNKTVPYNYRVLAIRLGREALSDYLHTTRALPYTYAELISKNSTHVLYQIMSRVPFSVRNFPKKFAKFLRYNPINEFEFFFESIGIGYGDVHRFLKPNVHFFTDDCAVLDAACCLAAFGFPWDKLGRLYLEEISIFGEKPEVLRRRLDELVSLGFSKEQIVGICLTIPWLLKVEKHGMSGENDALLDDLKRVFVDFSFGSSMERSVDAWSEVCRKVKVFYDLGVTKGKVGKRLDELVLLGFNKQQIVGICLTIPSLLKVERHGLIGENDALLDDLKRVFLDFDFGSSMERSGDAWSEVCRKVKVFYDLGVAKGKVGKLIVNGRCILTDFSEDVLIQKVKFFSRLGVCKTEIGSLILSYPKILSMKLDDRVISVSSLLEHLGMSKEQIRMVEQNYKHVFGRNTMVNLPSILRAMDLHEWFFQRMKSGYIYLFANYDSVSPDDGVDEDYIQNMERIKNGKTCNYSISKLNFLNGVGFGENGVTMKLLSGVEGTPSDLQARFDFLLTKGVEHSKLCKMMIRAPKMLNQNIDNLSKKIDFLEEVGLPLDCLEAFPAYLVYNLEKRSKRRYKFHLWLIEQGLCTKKYTLSSIIANSHNAFLKQLSCMHPTAPQLWLERYGDKSQG